jgi:hypothetical protein
VSLGYFRWESFGGAGTIIDAWALLRFSASATFIVHAQNTCSTAQHSNPRTTQLSNFDMADNVGLTTPRGSGTSGYVQKNRSLLRPRDKVAPYPKDWEHAKHRPRQPDAEILEHEAKRDIEVKVFELRDKLEEEGCVEPLTPSPLIQLTLTSVDEDEIDDQCEALRRKLDQERKEGKELGPNAKRLKSHQVHDLAKAKMEESERLRKALGISADYEEGSHWRKQEERMRESLAKREAEDEVKTERAKEARRYKEDDSD